MASASWLQARVVTVDIALFLAIPAKVHSEASEEVHYEVGYKPLRRAKSDTDAVIAFAKAESLR